jgi:hypothetical protein
MCTGTHDFIPALNTAKLELVVSAFGQRAENVLHFRKPTAWDAVSLDTLANQAFAAWDAHIAPMTSNAVTLEVIKATDVAVEDGLGVEVDGDGHTGTHTSAAAMPLGTTAATKFSSGFTGRSRRGRAYFIGLSKDQVSNNQLATGVAADLSDMWAAFVADIAADMTGVEHVIVSYCHDNAWRTNAVVTPVTDYTTNQDIDSMRRRLTGRGA